MREIKFRGKRVDNGRWEYGFYIEEPIGINSFCSPHIVIPVGTGHGEYAVDPETVGQYTGIKDCAGKEIYEGDILRGSDYPFVSEGMENYRAVIAYEAPRFYSYIERCSDRVRGCAVGDYVFEDGKQSAKRFNVIGNIHDNPELLEESANK